MREVLFRGLRVDGCGWVYGTGITDFLNVYPDKNGCWLWSNYAWVEIDKATVGQYAGQEDRNGVGIYEGDIVKLTEDDEIEWTSEVKENGEVDTQEFCSDYDATLLKWFMQHSFVTVEVIGNIHDEVKS